MFCLSTHLIHKLTTIVKRRENENKKILLTSIALGLSLLTTSVTTQAALPAFVSEQQLPSLSPMLEKVLPAVVSISVEGKQKSRYQYNDIPEEFKFSLDQMLSKIMHQINLEVLALE